MHILFAIKSVKKFFLIGVFTLTFSINFFFSAPPAHAQFWGTANIFSDLMMNIVNNIQEQIKGAVLGALQTALATALNSQVGQLVGGTSAANALFITDWNDYLYGATTYRTKLLMNDFFTITTRGKYASANYVGIGDTSATVAGNYPAYLVARAAASMPEQTDDLGIGMGSSYDLDEYAPNPDAIFRGGNFRGLNAFISNPANNPFGFTLQAQTYYARRYSAEVETARTKSQSSGFLGKEVNGRTIAPAQTIADMVSNTQNIGNTLIAAANNPAQFLSGVVNAVVNKAIGNLVQNGIGRVQASIRREVQKVDQQLYKFNKQLKPGAQFLREANQKTNAYVKPFTAAPPVAGSCTLKADDC